MWVLGIQGEPRPVRSDRDDVLADLRPSGWYHDAAAVLLQDGHLVAAIEEERLNRQKHSGRFPAAAIRFCLERGGIGLDAVDVIAFGERGGQGPYQDPAISPAQIASVLQAELGCDPGIAERVTLVEHHVAHAVSAYVGSGFDESLVVTADGFGDGVAGYVSSVRNNAFTILDRIEVANSLGRFYGAPLAFLGFDAFSEYKLMGLAPYGDPARFRAAFQQMYVLQADGKFAMTAKSRAETLDGFARLGCQRQPDGPIEQIHCDVAAAMQDAVETILRHVLRHFRSATGHRRLCLAGGTAQNCVATGKFLAEGIFDDIFVQPAATDAGNALGAAFYAALSSSAEAPVAPSRRPMAHVFLGGDIPPPSDVLRMAAAWNDLVEIVPGTDICTETARLLADGLVVGWVQGRSEFGPRALGHRSILADPRPADNRARINAMVKKREGFRPFAPSVLEERAAAYFDLPGPAGKIFPFMTFAVPVDAAWRAGLGAVTHVDGTARVQTVSRAVDPTYWRLIDAFAQLTGVPVLLNTSFNNHAEPIVETCNDAMACFLTTELDRLVVGDVILRKRGSAATRMDRSLRLVAHLAPGAVLTQGLARSEDTRVHLLQRVGRRIPVSASAFRVIAEGANGSSAADLLGARVTPDERAALARELHDLWASRLIAMRPAGTDI